MPATNEKIRQHWGSQYHCKLPGSITVQLRTSQGEDLPLDLVYCSLYITIVDHDDCYAYHLIPTDAAGRFTLTKEDMIYNTELQFWYTDKLPQDESQVSFELMITPKAFIRYFKRYTGNEFGEKPDKEYEQPLTWQSARSKFFDEQFDRVWPDIQRNRNLDLTYDSDTYSISGCWENGESYTYELILNS